MESSGKSNSRVILGAQRARNKTVLMGADQLEALRGEADASSVVEEVSDLLGVVEPTIEAEGGHHPDFEGSLIDALPDQEEQRMDAPSEKLATDALLEDMVREVSVFDFGDTFDDSLDSSLSAERERIVTRDDGQLTRVDDDEPELEETRHLEMSFEEPSEPEKPRIIRVGSSPISSEELSREGSRTPDGEESVALRGESEALYPTTANNRRGMVSEHLRQKRGCRDALVGFLVSFDDNPRGEFVELREGRMIVTSDTVGSASCLLLAHPSVCPMHAIMKIVCGEPLHILDQLSEFGTRIISVESGQEQRLSGDKGMARHGDVVYFGERKFHVCLVSVEMDDSE